ncbi:hypothetical protein G7046_g1832 [Stylonectria norvegica]|nr:hypothetical protein G7046_g1832 [Stylonectria norvegica]
MPNRYSNALLRENNMSRSGSDDSIIPQIAIDPSQLKRTTCDACRERKVKCDRTKPECLRCKRSRHNCTYPSADGEATKLNSALQTLHARLVQTELKLQQRDMASSGGHLERSTSIIHLDGANPHEDSVLSTSVMDAENSMLDDLDSWNDSIFFDGPDTIANDRQVDANESRRSKMTRFDSSQANLYTLSDGNYLTDTWGTSGPQINSSAIPRMRGQGVLAPEQTHDAETGDLQRACSPEEAPPEASDTLFEAYFDVVQPHLPLVNRDRFLFTTASNSTQQCQALKAAIAMSGAASIGDSESASRWYKRARSHIEKAEMELDNSSFLTLDTAQALLLVARFEFSHASGALQRALLTMAKLSQLLLLLGYDRLDETSMEPGRKSGEANAISTSNSCDMDLVQEKRCIFWIAFSMRSIWSLSLSHVLLSNSSEIFTKLPVVSPEDPDHKLVPFSLDGTINQHMVDTLHVFPLFILSVHHLRQTSHHQKLTTANVEGTGAQDYNFCLMHEKLDSSANSLLASLMSPTIASGTDGTELRILGLLITLSARIRLYKAAIVNVQKAEFLTPVVGECQRMGVMTANAMSDILLEADVLSENQNSMYRAMSIFIMPALATAAEIQLCVLKKGIKEMGQNIFYTNRETRQSLETICSAMISFKASLEHYDATIEEAQTFLDIHSPQVGGKRPNSDFDGKPSPQRLRTGVRMESARG